MRLFTQLILFGVLLVGLSGCFELIEDTTVHKDGSGEYKLTVNLSASQTRLNSLMALDSLNGRKIPSEAELENEIMAFTERMNQASGISNAQSKFSKEDWILKFSCSFDSLPAIKNAIYEATNKWRSGEKNKGKHEQITLTFQDHVYTRSLGTRINDSMRKQVREDKDFGKLSQGKCVFIQRFDQTVKSISQSSVKIAKNNKACMLIVSPVDIFENPSILDYSVKLNP